MLTNRRGFIALISVTIIGAILLMVGLATAAISQTQLQVAASTHEELRNRDYAAACLEEAILRLKLNEGYAGPTVVPFPGTAATCTVSAVGADPADPSNLAKRQVLIVSAVGLFTKKIDARLLKLTNPAGNAVAWKVNGWLEVDP